MFSKKCLICIPCEHKSFWQSGQLDGFIINLVAILFLHERLKIPEAYSEPSQKSKLELFPKIINDSTFSGRNCNLSDWVLNTFLPASQESFTYFQGKKFRWKKLGELRNEFLQIFGETLPNKLLHLPKTNLFIISLNKKTK